MYIYIVCYNILYKAYYIFLNNIFVHQKSLKGTFKTGFWVQNHFWICVLLLWIPKGYFVFKKLVWNVRIEAFWYTKCIIYIIFLLLIPTIYALSIAFVLNFFATFVYYFCVALSLSLSLPLLPFFFSKKIQEKLSLKRNKKESKHQDLTKN